MERSTAIAWVSLTAALLAWPAGALTPAERCDAEKRKAAGQYASCRLNAAAKAITQGAVADASKCEAKLAAKWATIETRAAGSCPVSGDLGSIQSLANSAVAEVAATIGGDPLGGCPADLLTCASERVTCDADQLLCQAALTSCQAETVFAATCGNGIVDAGEDCDFATLGGGSCAGEGYAGGVLTCGANCAYDVSNCDGARFIDNGDGTIIDTHTSLMWEKKVALDGTPSANPQDADNRHPWAGACANGGSPCQLNPSIWFVCQAATNAAPACLPCNGATEPCLSESGGPPTTIWSVLIAMNASAFAGHSDWRVPTRQELQSLVDEDDPTPPKIYTPFDGGSCGAGCVDPMDPGCNCAPAGRHWVLDGGTVGFDDHYANPSAAWHFRAVRGGS